MQMFNWQRILLPLGLVAGGIVCLFVPGGQALAAPLITAGLGLAGGTALKPVVQPTNPQPSRDHRLLK